MKNIDNMRDEGQGDEKTLFYDRIFENEMNLYM